MKLLNRVALVEGLIVAIVVLLPLSARAQSGALKVTSYPSGASVTIDGAPTGKVTP